jgi:anti-sigma regulatory factor (Ser/Thr protein kinase)
MKLSIQQIVKDESAQVLFKVRVKTLARKLGFDSVSIENMLIVVSEMISNQIKYSSKTGMIQLWHDGDCHSHSDDNKNKSGIIDIFAMDFGPGIENLDIALKDGYTTSRTMGKGLGSIKRMTDEYDIYSLQNQKTWHGVAVWGRFYRDKNDRPKDYQLGLFSRAYHDMAENGDDIWLKQNKNQLSCLHLDATGHGREAEKLVKKIHQIKADIHGQQVPAMLEMAERTLSETAGAVGTAIKFNPTTRKLDYSAVGDMRLLLIKDHQSQELETASGILGDVVRSNPSKSMVVDKQALFISTSDGIRRSWRLDDYPGLWDKHPQMISFFLGNHKGRVNDDQSMLVIKAI